MRLFVSDRTDLNTKLKTILLKIIELIH